MKKIILLSIIFLSQFAFSQEEPKIENKKKIVDNPDIPISFYMVRYNNLGDNFLGEAHKNSTGFGTEFNLLKVYGFTLGGALELSSFKITDPSLAGNIHKTNYTNISARVSYSFDISEQFSLKPFVGIGDVKLRQKSSGRDFGKFKGTSYNLGVNLVYNATKNVHFFTGINYNYVSYWVNSNPEFQSFFDRSNQIQIHLGIGFF